MNFAFSSRPLEDHLFNISREMSRFGRQLASLMEEVGHLKSTTAASNAENSEATDRMGKLLSAHESQLKVMQQTAAMTVTSSQFNSSFTLVKEQIKALELQVAKFEGPNSKKTLEVFEAAIEDYVTKWYRATVQKDMDTREVRAQEHARLTIERETHTLATSIDAQIQTIQRQMSTFSTIDQLRNVNEQAKDRVKHESERVEDRLSTFAATADKSNKEMLDALSALDARLVHVASRVAPLVAYDEGVKFGSSATAPAGNVPSPTKSSVTAVSTSNIASVDATAAVSGTVDAPQSLFILRSPAFTAFRQQVLEDIRARLGLAKNENAAESDEQLHDVRLEVKQRTTPERVIELIRQHQDVSTPAAVAELTKVVQRLDQSKVSQTDFVEGLRAKGDLHVVEGKADTFAVQEVVGALQSRIDRLETTMAQHQSEREEFRETLRDVVYMHKRAQVLGSTEPPQQVTSSRAASRSAAVPGGPVMKPVDSGVTQLPAIMAGQTPRPPPQFEVDPRGYTASSSRSRVAGGSSTPNKASKSSTPIRVDAKPAVVDLPEPPAGGTGSQTSRDRSTMSISQRAYADKFGSEGVPSDVSQWSAGLKSPGDRETMPYKSEVTKESASRRTLV